MSAEVLREAAALMRERADGAMRSPWDCLNDRQIGTQVEGYGWADICEPLRKSDARHIVSWHPAVALAVAELLDDLAMGVELGLLNYAAEQTALAVARAYLGSDR